jgi:hypothetical protein
MADLIIILFSTFLVLIARGMVDRDGSVLGAITRHRFAVLLVVIFSTSSAFVFVERKEQRLGTTHQICVTEKVCADYDYPLFKPLDDRERFALSMASVYFSQGYFGLSLALTKDFQSTWGLGHSLALMNYYSALTGNEDLYEISYTFRLRDEGWSDLNRWSTMFPWLANDIGFTSVPLVIGLLAWIWGTSWKDAVLRNNDRAVIVFVFMMLIIFYMPANNQVTQTIDAYFAIVCWNIVWLVDRLRTNPKRR